jgi:hypothetical protein
VDVPARGANRDRVCFVPHSFFASSHARVVSSALDSGVLGAPVLIPALLMVPHERISGRQPHHPQLLLPYNRPDQLKITTWLEILEETVEPISKRGASSGYLSLRWWWGRGVVCRTQKEEAPLPGLKELQRCSYFQKTRLLLAKKEQTTTRISRYYMYNLPWRSAEVAPCAGSLPSSPAPPRLGTGPADNLDNKKCTKKKKGKEREM